MENFEIQNFENFASCFFCATIDMYYLSNDQSPEKESEHVETIMTSFDDVKQRISNEELQDEIIDFDAEIFIMELFSNVQKYKNRADEYCRNTALTEEKIVLGAYIKFIISIFSAPTQKQTEYLDSFIEEYGLSDFKSQIDILYKSIKNDSNQDILEDW